MSDPHRPEDSAHDEDAEGRSAVRLSDAPSDHESAHETTAGTASEGVEHDDTHETPDAVAHDEHDEHDEHDDETEHDEHVDDTEHVEHAGIGDADDTHETHDVHGVDADDDHDDDRDGEEDAEPAGSRGASRTALFAAVGVAAVAIIGVLVLLAAFVWPDFTGPGSPDATGQQAVAALGSKDPAQIDKVNCHRADGRPATQLPPEALQLIQKADPAGPVQKTLDSEARVPVNLTLSAGGQTQAVPAELVLSVNDGAWCMNGIGGGSGQ